MMSLLKSWAIMRPLLGGLRCGPSLPDSLRLATRALQRETTIPHSGVGFISADPAGWMAVRFTPIQATRLRRDFGWLLRLTQNRYARGLPSAHLWPSSEKYSCLSVNA